MSYRCVFNIAPAGAGKGTLSAHLEAVFDPWTGGPLTILSMSQLLKTLCRQDGGLVDDTVVIDTFRKAFTELLPSRPAWVPFIYVDGFPRTPQQAETLQGLFTPNEHQQCLIVHWQVSPFVSIDRQMYRWRSQNEDPALRRPDYVNSEKAAREQAQCRLEIHHKSEEEILNVLRQADFEIATLDANGDPDNVCREFLTLTGWPVNEDAFFDRFKHHFDDFEDTAVA